MRFVAPFLLVSALTASALAADPPKIDLKKGIEFTGRAQATVVEVRPRVTGFLDQVRAREGDVVKKGDVLAEVDDRIYSAELKLAKAKLAMAQAKMKLAEGKLTGTKRLFEKGIVSKEEVEYAEGELAVAKADVDAGGAAVELAELQLSFTKVLSPIDGRVGRFATTPGNLLKAGETRVVSVIADGAIVVAFDVDERTMLAVNRAVLDNAGKPAVAVGLGDEDGFPHTGSLNLTSCEVDPKTGTIQLRATLANPNGLIVNGSFLRVRLTVQPGK